MDGLPVVGHIVVHLAGRDVGQFAAVAAAAHADIGLHGRHDRAVPGGAPLELFHARTEQQLAVERLVGEPEKRSAAHGVHFFDQRAHEVVVAADGFDEDVFAGLEVAGKRDQPVRELLDARIEHMGYLRY